MGQDKEADVVQVKLSHWLKANPVKNNKIDDATLDKDPEPFSQFVKKADLWGLAMQKMVNFPTGKTAVNVGEDNDNDYDNVDVGKDVEKIDSGNCGISH